MEAVQILNLDKLENIILENALIFINTSQSTQKKYMEYIVANNHNINYLDNDAQFLKGMNKNTYLDFCLKWFKPSQKDEIKAFFKDQVLEEQKDIAFLINLVINPYSIVSTFANHDLLENTDFINTMQWANTNLNKKFIFLTDCIPSKYVENFKFLYIDGCFLKENSMSETSFNGVSETTDETIIFTAEEVLFFESINSLVYAQLEDDRVVLKKTLKSLDNFLVYPFFRSHRCYIVNLKYIRKFIKLSNSNYSIIIKGHDIPLSKYRLKKFKKFLELQGRNY